MPSLSEKNSFDMLKKSYDEVMVPNYAPIKIALDKALGSKLWDIAGKEYIDFSGGVAVNTLGHSHPKLIDTLYQQAKRCWHSSNLIVNEPTIRLAKELCKISFSEKVFFANSGAEANEAALKLARRYALNHYNSDKTEIVAFTKSFHGRTFFTVCTGGQLRYSDGFGPKPANISHLPFNDIHSISNFFRVQGSNVCCVILELIQAEGGVQLADKYFVKTIRKLCNQFNALLIFDEIQTGVGRSGKMYLYEKFDVVPDILTTAKGLGGGFPIGAMLTTQKIAKSLTTGTHGSTFGGNPMACSVAYQVIKLINNTDVLSNVKNNNSYLVKRLQQIGRKYKLFTEIRGEGMLLGCELTHSWKDRTYDLINLCVDEGLIILTAGPHVLRLTPALNINMDDIEEGLKRMEKAVNRLQK